MSREPAASTVGSRLRSAFAPPGFAPSRRPLGTRTLSAHLTVHRTVRAQSLPTALPGRRERSHQACPFVAAMGHRYRLLSRHRALAVPLHIARDIEAMSSRIIGKRYSVRRILLNRAYSTYLWQLTHPTPYIHRLLCLPHAHDYPIKMLIKNG